MNTELLYTVGVGNIRSHVSVNALQFVLYMISIDMTKPIQGILIALFLSSIVATIDMGLIHYYSSAETTVGSGTKYVRNIDDKIRIFRKITLISYGASLTLLTLLYFAGIGVAPYFMFTGPGSLVVLMMVMVAHDYSVNMRYAQLKKANWVFDYSKIPTVRTVSTGMNVGISMFNDQNEFVVNETTKSLNLDDIFNDLPPGTKMTGNRIKKPEFRELTFNTEFKYTSMKSFKSINLKKETKHDMKLFNLYMNALGKYSGLYLVEDGFVECVKTSIQINKTKIEKYIENNDYIKRFVPAKDAEVAFISIMLKPDLSKQSLKKFLSKNTKEVPVYKLEQNKKGLFVIEKINDQDVRTDISYLQQYMSLNLEEYQCQKSENDDNDSGFISLQEKLDGHPRNLRAADQKHGKNLNRLDIVGEHVYVFREDLKTLSEIDEIIISKFINRDFKEIHDKYGEDD